MDDFRVRKVSDLLGAILTPDAADTVRTVSAFYGSWEGVAGQRLAAHSRPVDIRNGVVFIEADHPGWIQMLQMQQDDLLERLRKQGRDLGITGIAFRLAHDPSLPGTARRTYPGSVSVMDEDDFEDVEAVSADVSTGGERPEDGEFRNILSSLEKTLRARPKK